MTLLDLLQWPAMLTTLVAAWAVASSQRGRRMAGFVIFLVSNVLWSIWAVHTGANALLVLQIGLALMNVRGLLRHHALEPSAERAA